MRRIGRFGLAVLLAGVAPVTALATFSGSTHDFSTKGWNTTGQSCVVCHTPHNATANTQGLLWNRNLTAAVFTLYTSPGLKSTVGQPDGTSKLCLSCHDGTIAIDSFGGKIGTNFIGGVDKMGTDLSNDHPVSMVYDSALAAAKPTLADPAVALSGLGGTIAADMTKSSKVQCSSCHDVHNHYGNLSLLLKPNTGSALCLTCHKL